MKQSFEKGTSNQKPYMPFFRRPIPPKAIEPPPTNLNIDLEGVAMDNYCNYHQDNHSKKTCP
jgi:hypothetical protein